MTSIESILNTNGPLMSSEIARKLEESSSIPYNTASQRVSRNNKILRIKGFFQSGQSLCYLKTHENGELFKKLNEYLFEFGRKYWYCLNAIKLHGGTIERKYLECFTNYPISPLKKHIPFDKVMQMFVKEEILIFDGDYYHLLPKFGEKRASESSISTIDFIKTDILDKFEKLTKNIGLISYNSGEHFAEYGKFRWAFKGASNITGLINNGKPGFLLADIIIGTPIYKNDVLFFIEKLKHIQSFNNASKLIPFLLVANLDNEALIYLKQHGVVVGFIRELFGQKYADALVELITILNNAGASLKQSPEKYLDLIKELKKYNKGLVNNIKGALFEFVVAHIHSTISNSSIDLGRVIYENGAQHELDVLATYPDKVVMAECKAVKSKIDYEYVDVWLGKKLPAFKKYFDNQDLWKKKNLEFEIWSVSGFTDEALKKLDSIVDGSKKYKLTYYQPQDIQKKAKELNNKKLKESLDDYFLKIDV